MVRLGIAMTNPLLAAIIRIEQPHVRPILRGSQEDFVVRCRARYVEIDKNNSSSPSFLSIHSVHFKPTRTLAPPDRHKLDALPLSFIPHSLRYAGGNRHPPSMCPTSSSCTSIPALSVSGLVTVRNVLSSEPVLNAELFLCPQGWCCSAASTRASTSYTACTRTRRPQMAGA